MAKTVQVSDKTHQRLAVIKGKLETKRKKLVSMAKVIDYLLEELKK